MRRGYRRCVRNVSACSTPRQLERPFCRHFLKPFDGLEPSTPSLPWRFSGVTRDHARSSETQFYLQINNFGWQAVGREASRVSFLMCPFCVRVLSPGEATPAQSRRRMYLPLLRRCVGGWVATREGAYARRHGGVVPPLPVGRPQRLLSRPLRQRGPRMRASLARAWIEMRFRSCIPGKHREIGANAWR